MRLLTLFQTLHILFIYTSKFFLHILKRKKRLNLKFFSDQQCCYQSEFLNKTENINVEFVTLPSFFELETLTEIIKNRSETHCNLLDKKTIFFPVMLIETVAQLKRT